MRPLRLAIATPPAAEPVVLADVKGDLRVTLTDEDAVLTRWILEAREQCEARTHRRLITQTWDAFFDGFGPLLWSLTRHHAVSYQRVLVLSDLTPVQSVTSIKYIDPDGVEQTLPADQYQLVKTAPAKIVPAYGVSWPETRCQPEAVTVRAVAGYGTTAADVPESLKSWIRATVGLRDRYREAATARPAQSVAYIDGLLATYIVPEL